jgi:hypothetical protein
MHPMESDNCLKRLVWKLEENNIQSIGLDNRKNIKTNGKKIRSKYVG